MSLPPLTRREPCFGGWALLLFSIIWVLIRYNNVEIFDVDTGTIDTQTEVIELHHLILHNKTQLILSAIALWMLLPLTLIHIYCMQRVYDRLFEKDMVMIDFLRFLYIRSWIIKMVIVSVIYSPILIVAAYYDWTFTDGDTVIYTGYYVQLFCVHYAIVLGDAVLIASAITGVIPWCTICIICWRKQQAYFSSTFRSNILPLGCGDNRCFLGLLMVFVILIVFGAMSAMFDFGSKGFYSIYGGSQFLAFIVTVSNVLISLWMFWIAIKVDDLEDADEKAIYSAIPNSKTADDELL
mmetsp:Transcript_72688/g.115998  ORF Transcript_72688/g.115998 Transcript_72688/m.115998 type:complete len:295 (-) Transcript_72688:38-922(-)